MLDRILTRYLGDGFEKEWWVSVITQTFSALVVLSILVLASLWFLGGQSTEYEGSINISASSKAIFEQLVNPEKRLKWQSGTSAISLKSTGPLESKSKFKVVMNEGSQTVEAIDEVMQLMQDEWFSYRTSAPHLDRITVFKIQPALDPETEIPLPGVMRLVCRSTEQAANTSRLRAAFFRRDVKTRVETELAQIKALAEAAGR